MKIKSLRLKNYCGFKDSEIIFGDFTVLYGPNGIGKTTVLGAISLLCSSLDYSTNEAPIAIGGMTAMTISPEARLKQVLKKNIRNIDEQGCENTFLLDGTFEHEGKDYSVILNQNGFIKNEILKQSWWNAGLTYTTKFDSDMGVFNVHQELWPKFSQAYENITGYKVDPEFYDEINPETRKKETYALNFFLNKPNGRLHSRKCSAGEKKIAKALSQVVNLEEDHQPDIALIDNIEMHIHYKRHLTTIEEMKKLFDGIQIIATTHSGIIIEQYEPKEHLINIEEKQNGIPKT